jgi:putative Holliday junction resolvase
VGRIVGFDVGERRIGVAVSDPTGTLARPVATLPTTGLDGNALQISLDELARLAGDDPLDAIVVGLPRHLDGSANDMTPRIERFAARLRDRVGLAVILQDERLTSVEAESRLAVREKNWRVRKGRLDAAAAAVMLQDYLDNHR